MATSTGIRRDEWVIDPDNRVEQLLKIWKANHPVSRFWVREQAQLELEFLDKLYMAFKDSPSYEERESLARVEAGIKHLSYQLKPDLMERLSTFIVRALDRATFLLSNLLENRANDERLDRGFEPKWVPKGLSATARQEKEAQVSGLMKSLKTLGLSGKVSEQGRTLLYYGSDSFQLNEKVGPRGARASVTTQVEKSPLTGRYYATGYDMVSYRGLTPLRDEAVGVNVKELDRRMAAINWSINYAQGGGRGFQQGGTNSVLVQAVNDVFRDLGVLLASGDSEARRIHDQLAVKYFADTPNSQLVGNFDEIKKTFEHKVHVDLTMDAAFPLTPADALKLLNRGVITRSEEPGGLGQPWLSLVSERDARGFHQIRPIEGSDRFSLHAGLAEANVVGFGGHMDEESAIRALAKGEVVSATVVENGEHVERMIYANPEKGKISVDWVRTEEAGLLQRDEQLTTTFSKYRVQQQSGVQDRQMNAQPEMTLPTQQTTLFQDDPPKMTSDRTNLSSLERQLLEIGAPPGVAAEVLHRFKATGDPEVNLPHVFERDGDQVNTQLRFKLDSDLDWVRLHGYDVNVNFGNGDQAVSQRFYYNSEDPVNSFSLSEAYNLAKGNPVARVVVDMEGQQKEVWKQLDVDRPLTPAGNHQITSYEFDLKAALAEYPNQKDLQKALGAGISISDLVARAKMGETTRFPANLNGTDEMWIMRVLPGEHRFEIVRSPESQASLREKQQGENVERGVTVHQKGELTRSR